MNPTVRLLCFCLILLTVGCDAIRFMPGLSPADGALLAKSRVDAAIPLFAKGDEDGGIRLLTEAAEFLGQDGAAYAKVTKWLTAAKRGAEAVRLMEKASQNKEVAQDPLFWEEYGKAQAANGNTAGGDESRRKAKQIADAVIADIGKGTPNTDVRISKETARFLLTGVYLDTANKNEDAIRVLAEAERLSPNHPLVMNAYGYILANKGIRQAQWLSARSLTGAALQVAPGDPGILDSYGWALFRLGDLDGARRVLREAVDAAPSESEIVYHLGRVYEAQKLYGDAASFYDRALVLDPDSKEALTAKNGLPSNIMMPKAQAKGIPPMPAVTPAPQPSRPAQSPEPIRENPSRSSSESPK